MLIIMKLSAIAAGTDQKVLQLIGCINTFGFNGKFFSGTDQMLVLHTIGFWIMVYV